MPSFNALPDRTAGVLVSMLVLGLSAGLMPWAWLFGGIAMALPLVHPVLGLALLVLSVTAQDSVRLAGGLSLTQAAIPLALAGWGARMLMQPPQQLARQRSVAAWGLFLTALLWATALSPYAASEGMKELWRWGAACLAWIIAATTVRKPWHYAILIAALLGAPLLNALLGLGQFALGDGPQAFRIAAESPYVRAYGTIGQPNSFAGYMNLAWPLALALAICWSWQSVAIIRRHWGERRGIARAHKSAKLGMAVYASRIMPPLTASLLWVITGILLAALAASFSRGAWLGALAGLLGMLLAVAARIGWRIFENAWLVTSLCLICGALVLLAIGDARVVPSAILVRMESITSSLRLFDPGTVAITSQNFAVVERMAQLWAGWQMFLAHPLSGVGPGSYNLAYPAVASSPWFASRGHAHNYYLHIAAEAGILGLTTYILLLGMVLGDLWRGLQRSRSIIRRGVLIGTCGMIAAMAGHNLFENLHVLHLSIHSAAAWGMAAAIAQTTEEN